MDEAIYERLTTFDAEDLKPEEKQWLQRYQEEHLNKTLRPKVETEVHSTLLTQFMPLYDELPDAKKKELAPAAYASQHGAPAWYKAVYEASLEHRTTTKQGEWQKDEAQRIQAALEADRAARRAATPAPDLTNGNGSVSSITMADYLRMTARERTEWDRSHNAEEKKAMEATWAR